MATISVTDSEFDTKVLQNKVAVLVDFWATWCGPCKMAAPVLGEISEEHKDQIVIAKMDVDANQTTSSKYGIMSIPTTVLFKDGKEVGREVGFKGKKSFEDLMKRGL